MPARKATKAKRPATQRAVEAPRETCFVMMSFTQLPKTYYDLVYRPAIEAAGLQARRADDIYAPSPIISDIWREIHKARVMLADLSFRNPNVMYELGLAHALGKPVVMLTQSIPDVPFDLQSYRLIPYAPIEPDWADKLSDEISRSIHDVLKTPTNFILPVFLRESRTTETPAVSGTEKRIASVERAVDRIEAQIRSVSARANPSYVNFSRPAHLYPVSLGGDAGMTYGFQPTNQTIRLSSVTDPLNEAWSLNRNPNLVVAPSAQLDPAAVDVSISDRHVEKKK